MNSRLLCLAQEGKFELRDAPQQALQPDQILIEQRVIALNSLDYKQYKFGILVKNWPYLLGIEGAGIIREVGATVKDLYVGDEVVAWAPGRAHGDDWGGTYQRFVVVPRQFVFRRPQNMTLEEAVSLPVCFNTAVCAITLGLQIELPFLPVSVSAPQVPEAILILGASSATGVAAIQLLKLAFPALVILGTASPKHFESLRLQGITKCFDYNSESLVQDVITATPGGRGVDMILDCVGAGDSAICSVYRDDCSKLYSSVITGKDIQVSDDVQKKDINGYDLVHIPGGDKVIPSLTELVETGRYKTPLPVKVLGHGLEDIPKVFEQSMYASGRKLLITL